MWSFARQTLKLSDAEFWALDLRRFAALKRRHREAILHTEQLAGIIAASVANYAMNRPKDPLEHWRFMPSNWGKEEQIQQRIDDLKIGNLLMSLTKS